MSGRAGRFSEGLYNSLNEAVLDVQLQINKKISSSNYAIYGHSMGALITYELIKQSQTLSPKHVFISGLAAPRFNHISQDIHLLPDSLFIDEVKKLNGTPPEIFENNELMALFLPVLRSDFKIISEYSETSTEKKIKQNLNIFYGSDEGMKAESILAWREYTEGTIDSYEISGDHFFVNTNYSKICDLIKGAIFPYLY
ncbi:thioesterase [Paenibacillus silvae]|uniref:Thioesterase n=1 Tax=Paenibacillus silvae TaxID=1325358 RepID=A0ABQ1Z4X3_9BACL|nr:thioesterase [Paenibacillus silvae]